MAGCGGAGPQPADDRANGKEAPGAAPSAQVAASPASVILQPITYPDIEAHQLYGASCAYGSGTSMASLVIARHGAASIKMDGRIVSLAPVAGSALLPYGSRSAYANDHHTLELAIIGPATAIDPSIDRAKGTIRLIDTEGRAAFSATGSVQCGA